MMRWSASVGVGLLLGALLAGPAWAQTEPDGVSVRPPGRYVEPEPSVIPLSWQLDIKAHRPGRVVVKDESGQDAYYWYVIYTVSNPSNKTIDFMPRITMLTDNLDLHDAQLALPPELFERIKQASNAKYLEDPLQVTRVLSGEDNARDTVAVFPLKGDPKWFRVFFCGFSGEQWPMSVPGDNPGETRMVTMEKVRVMEFAVPGNTPPDRIPPVELRPGSDKWTMRAMPKQTKYAIDLSRVKQGKDPVYAVGEDGQPPKEQPKEPPAPGPANTTPPTTAPTETSEP